MQLNISKALYTYWFQIKGDRTMPTRAELKPGPIAALLPDLFMLDVSPHQDLARFRLAGTRVCAMLGCELAGRDFLTLWTDAQRSAVADVLDQVIQSGTPMLLGLSGGEYGGDPVGFEMLLLPLRGDDGHASRVLGSLAPESSPVWQMMHPVQSFVVLDASPITVEQPAEAAESTASAETPFETLIRWFVPATLRPAMADRRMEAPATSPEPVPIREPMG